MKKSIFLVPAIACFCFLIQNSPVPAEQFLENSTLSAMSVPSDNPQTDSKIRLGKQLYFDKRLSADNTISCATCHAPKTGWVNRNPTDTGIKGQVGGRNSGSIVNSGYMKYQFWDGREESLEGQALGPIHNPIEMGETLENVVQKLNAIPEYKTQFQEVFGTAVTTDGIAKAIAAFERTIVSEPSPYDKYIQGDKKAMSDAAIRGMNLFNGKAHCTLCHSGPAFSDQRFHNLGIGYKDGKMTDVGRFKVTNNKKDMGAFKTPTLRNIAETAPYLHDGSEKTLESVVELYNKGGVFNPDHDDLMVPLHLTKREKVDVVEYLKALTGPVKPVNE